MKKTTKLALFVGLVLLTCALMFTACDSNNETPTTNEPNDTKTEETTSPTITVDNDGYVIVNGVKTEHKIHTTDEISVNADGYVVVNGVATNIVADKDDIISVDADGYVIVNGVKTEYEIKNNNHSFSEWELYNEEETDCEKKLFYRVCPDCSTIEWKEGKYEDHNFTTVTTPATCQAKGYDTKTCNTCGKIEVCNETPISSTNHSFGDWYEKVKVTCVTDGTDERACVCGATETKTVAALGNAHVPVIDEAIAPTYTARGKSEGSHCSLCNAVLTEQRDIATIWSGDAIEPTVLVQIDGIYYYEINSAEELAYLTTAPADWSGYNFVLKCDIWLNEEELRFDDSGYLLNTTSSLNSWRGFSCNRFLGNGHNIKGVYTTTGFIKECYLIKNVHLVNAYVRGNGDSTRGGICNSVGSAYYCSFDGVLYNPSYGGTPNNHYIGGIAGYINTSGGIVYGCTNYALIVNNCSRRVSIGGIVGDVSFNYEKIENCVNYGDIITNNIYCSYDNDGVSGIAARGYAVNCTNYGNIQGVYGVKGIGGLKSSGCINYGSISGNEHIYGVGSSATNCKNYGDITGTTYIGGIGATANKCENYGTVSGETYVGGIVGKASSPITNCINVGQVTGTEYVGAITGFFDIFDEDSYVSNCFYLKNDSINAEINGIGNLEDSAGVCEAKNEDFFEQE